MNNRICGLALCALLCACSLSAQAEQAAKIPRIGYLSAGSRSAQTARLEALLQGLRELGYVEGKSIAIEWRWADRKFDRLPDLAAELVRLPVEIIVSAGPAATRAATNATSTIPIVMGFDNDPVGSGFVMSLARPGGNVTGLSTLAPGLSGKQLELLKEIVPRLSRVTVIGRSAEPGYQQVSKELDLAAGVLKVKLRHVDVPDPKDTEAAFRAASDEHADAIILLAFPAALYRKQIVEVAAKLRIPTVYWISEFVQAGGLMYYGPSFTDLFRRIAAYVDKILKGATPADLPVEQPTKLQLVINLKAANQIGLTVPPSVLARADRVIK